MTTVGQLVFSGLLIGGIYGLMSIGLTLIFGVLRIVNFAHGDFLMIAMYGAWALTRYLGLNPYYAIVALMALSADLQDVPPILGGRSFTFGPFYAKPELLIGFAVALACTLGLRFMLQATYLGKAIRATVQDGEAAQLMGVPVPRIFLITFAAGSALVGLSACIMTPLFSVVAAAGHNYVLIAFVVVVLGGMGSIEGALLGGICIGIVQSLSSYYIAPAFGQMFFFMLFLLVMIFRPAGLLGRKGEATLGIND